MKVEKIILERWLRGCGLVVQCSQVDDDLVVLERAIVLYLEANIFRGLGQDMIVEVERSRHGLMTS